ncbi:ABC transporter ATP-binding protein, partial [Mesorhizobium sp. M3A.F.Ca.ET.174.01.1.1]
MSRLVVSNLSINRAELPVVTSVDLIAESGAISVVLFANGAGKAT